MPPRKPTPKKAAKAKIVKSKKPAAAQGAPVVVLSTNPAVARAFTNAVKDVAILKNIAAIDDAVATGARIVFIDHELPGEENCYEFLRKLRVRSALRLVLLHPDGKEIETSLHALARFAGAEAVLSSPPTPAEIKSVLKPRASRSFDENLISVGEQDAARTGSFEARVLQDITNPHDPTLLDAICDPETRLYSSAYGSFAYDLEFKRAQRFALPLSIAIVGFDGEAATETLLEIASIFLNEIRDTDTLARFNINSFFFVLPNTLADGARALLERIASSVTERGLRDLVGDKIQLNSGVCGLSLPSNESRDELFARAHKAYQKARAEMRTAVVG